MGPAPRSIVAVLLAIAGAGCAQAATNTTPLQAIDLQSSGSGFDPSEIVASSSMTDSSALDAAHVQAFLQKTPYGTASFLASYASHGTSAAQAIVAAAQSHAINPLLLLARAEMDQELVGSVQYPSPPSRVEFAFGCGCATGSVTSCDPTLAGFDLQVDCLAIALRQSLDAIAAHKTTAGGWGPGVASTTLDGVSVKPRDDSTAALYQYTPLVDLGQTGGNWLVWNLWNKYASFVGYKGPT